MAGRPPKPTKLKILTGNPGRRSLPSGEPQPQRLMPVCPRWLSAVAKQKWKDLAPKLFGLGLLTELDGETLAICCQAWAEFRAATQLLGKKGRNYLVKKYWTQRPEVAQQRSAWEAWKKYAALFGLSPSDRVGLQVSRGDGEQDGFEEVMKRGKKKA